MSKIMSTNMLFLLSFVISLILWTREIDFCFAQRRTTTLPTAGPNAPKYHVGYRTVNWCVTGKDEPELHEWPYSQFVPIIRRWNREVHSSFVRYDLRFYDINVGQPDVGFKGKLFKTVHVVFKAERRLDTKENVHDIHVPMEIEGLLIQANSNPYTIALPTGQFFPPGNERDPTQADVHCKDCNHTRWASSIACRKRAKIHVEHPTILAWHHMQPSFEANTPAPTPSPLTGELRKEIYDIINEGKQSEVHANFRWYSPKCSPATRMMFTVLVVRSFAKHQYDIFHRGPYIMTVRDQDYQSDLHPSPYFFVYTQQASCHGSSAQDITLEHPQKYRDFEMNHFFDCCIREEENRKTRITHELLGTQNVPTLSCYDKLYKAAKENKAKVDALTIPPGEERPVCFFPFAPAHCADVQVTEDSLDYGGCQPCRDPLTTTTVASTLKPDSIYKRTMHGGLMIMTNFCLQPIVIYIARFYKETFNKKKCKGAKSWYLMHMLGGFVSSTMVYFGIFSGGDDESHSIRTHVAIGKVYIITLGVCYISAWARHKNKTITIIAEFVHGCFGYVTIFLAVAAVYYAPDMGEISQILVYSMICVQGLFTMVVTCQICIIDKRIGMRPKRRHFPTVEARFDEIEVPGGKCRTWLLAIFAFITFVLSTASTFVE